MLEIAYIYILWKGRKRVRERVGNTIFFLCLGLGDVNKAVKQWESSSQKPANECKRGVEVVPQQKCLCKFIAKVNFCGRRQENVLNKKIHYNLEEDGDFYFVVLLFTILSIK